MGGVSKSISPRHPFVEVLPGVMCISSLVTSQKSLQPLILPPFEANAVSPVTEIPLPMQVHSSKLDVPIDKLEHLWTGIAVASLLENLLTVLTMFPMKADLNNLVRLPNRNFLNDAGIENSLGPLVTRSV